MTLAENYIFEVYLTGSFSEAAKHLFVSQPSVSMTVLRTEKTLGFAVFDRSTVPLTLTPRGRIYMDMLFEMRESEYKMREKLSELDNEAEGNLSIGSDIYAVYLLAPILCRNFNKTHPGVRVTVDLNSKNTYDTGSEKMQNHAWDVYLSYKTQGKNYDGLTFMPLLNDRLAVAVHRDLLKTVPALMPYAMTREDFLGRRYDDTHMVKDLSLFSSLPFLAANPSGNTFYKMKEILGETPLSSFRVDSTHNHSLHHNLMSVGLGAFLTSEVFARTSYFDESDICYLVPDHPSNTRAVYLLTHREERNKTVEAFLSSVRDLCENEDLYALLKQ